MRLLLTINSKVKNALFFFALSIILSGCNSVETKKEISTINENFETSLNSEKQENNTVQSTESYSFFTDESTEISYAEEDILDIPIPDEVKQFCSQDFKNVRLVEKLFVVSEVQVNELEKGKQIIINLLDRTKTRDNLTAILDESGKIVKYGYSGDGYENLYLFIDYMEGTSDITDDFNN